MRRVSRIPIVLIAAMLPLVVSGQDHDTTRPLWAGAQQSVRLGGATSSSVKVIRPGDQRADLGARAKPKVWRAAAGEIAVQRSPRRLSGLAQLFGSRDDRNLASSARAVQPASDARLQKKGRLP